MSGESTWTNKILQPIEGRRGIGTEMGNWGLRYQQVGFVLETRSLFSLHRELHHSDTCWHHIPKLCFLFHVHFLLPLLLHLQIWITSKMGSWIYAQEGMKRGKIFEIRSLEPPSTTLESRPQGPNATHSFQLEQTVNISSKFTGRKASIWKGSDNQTLRKKRRRGDLTYIVVYSSLFSFLCNRKPIVKY